MEGLITKKISIPDNLVLWNKLGSLSEFNHSEAGVGGIDTFGATYASGKFDRAMYFPEDYSSGSSGMYFSDPNLLFTPEGCIEVWVKTDGWSCAAGGAPSDGQALHMILSPASSASYSADNFYYYFSNNPLGLVADFYMGGSRRLFTVAGGSIEANKWTHFAISWSAKGSWQKCWQDGQAVDSASLDMSFPGTNPLNIELGKYYTTQNDRGWEGWMDNLKIWKYAKTDFSDRFTEGFENVHGQNKFDSISDSVISISKPGEHIIL